MILFINKKTIFFLIVIFGSISLFAQTPKINFEAERGLTQVTSNSFDATRLSLSFEGVHFLNVETEKGVFSELIMPGGHSVGALGTPKLPASNKLIEVPFGAEVSVRVLSYTIEEYRLSDFGVEHPLMPVQPSLRKDQDISEVPFEYKPEVYNIRGFIEPEIASVEVLGVMRGQRLGRLTVAPVHYNPADNSIRVYNNIELEIQYAGADDALTREIKASTFSPWFDVVYDQVINRFDTRDIFDDHPDLTKYPVKMVIVSHDDFQETLQPFIEWKTKQGFEIIEAYTSEVGSSASAIQNFIHAQYNAGTPQDPAPTFVVVVGDPTRLPASATGSASSQVTDLYYASVDGDMFPEMYLGRLSARTVQELQNQLDKILYYQQYEFTDPSYLNNATLIAGADATWNPRIGQPTVHYATQNYYNAANGFANVNAYLSSYAGVYDEERIAVSLINFTAHCNPTSWGNPNLSVSDVHNMTNSGRYPLAIGNCCQSALFSVPESIGEAWVRAENKGAVAYIGSAPNTHWFEDFYWAVGAFPISGNNNGYVPTVDETTMGAYDAPFTSDYVAVASVKFVGNLAITEAHNNNYPTHSNVLWYWQGYHTFGDPSTVIYFTEGSENNVSHMPTVPIGLDSYTVQALPGSYVGISMNGVLHGAAFVDESGEVDVPIEPILEGGDVTIVVTKPQYIPYVAHVPAAALEGSFVVIDHFEINDVGGTGQAFYGEEVLLDIALKNVGVAEAINVNASLSSASEYVTILDDYAEFGNIAEDVTTTLEGAFSVAFADNVPDQQAVLFTLTITDANQDTWESNFTIRVNAPVLEFTDLYVYDPDDKGATPIHPGQVTELAVEITNNGNATTEDLSVTALANSMWITVLTQDPIELPPLAPGETAEAVFTVSTLMTTPPESFEEIHFTALTGAYEFEGTKEVVIGEAPVYSDGDIPTTHMANPTTNSSAEEPGVMSVSIPDGAIITSVSVEYSMTAHNVAWMSEQRSFLRCVSEGGETEPQVYSGEGNSGGTYDYARTGLTIANGVTGGGEIEFELHAFRTWTGWGGSQGSDTDYNYVNNNTWKLIVYYELEGHDVTFFVKNQFDETLEGAKVEIFGVVHETDETGHTIFNLPQGTFLYNAWAENHRPVYNEHFTVNEESNTVEIELLRVFKAAFVVNDIHGDPIEGATIMIEGFYGDMDHYQIDDLLPGIYDFTISADGYDTYEGAFEIVDEDVNVEVAMLPFYMVTFVISDEFGLAVDHATVIIDGDAMAEGHYVTELTPEAYSYIVIADFYHDYSGEFVVADGNMEVEVVLNADGTDIDENVSIHFEVYPNPADNSVNIISDTKISSIMIIDIQGQTVLNKTADSNKLMIDIHSIRNGVYFIRIITPDGVYTEKLRILR